MLRVNNLIGFGARRRVGSFTFITSGDGTTGTVTIPGTPTAGDFCVIWSWFRNSVVSAGAASGFTSLVFSDGTTGAGAGTGGGRIQAKFLTGAETTVTIETGFNATRWICATFRPNTTTGSNFAGNDTTAETTNGDPASQTINASAAGLPHILLANFANDGTQTIGTMTKITHGTGAQFAAYGIVNSGGSPADVTVDQTDGGNQNLLQSLYVTFS